MFTVRLAAAARRAAAPRAPLAPRLAAPLSTMSVCSCSRAARGGLPSLRPAGLTSSFLLPAPARGISVSAPLQNRRDTPHFKRFKPNRKLRFKFHQPLLRLIPQHERKRNKFPPSFEFDVRDGRAHKSTRSADYKNGMPLQEYTAMMKRALEAQEKAKTADPSTLPYKVHRTQLAKQLPIYSEYKERKNQIFTVIRRIEGDLQALKKDLDELLPCKFIEINPLARKVILPGRYVHEVRDFLTARGF